MNLIFDLIMYGIVSMFVSNKPQTTNMDYVILDELNKGGNTEAKYNTSKFQYEEPPEYVMNTDGESEW